MENSTRLDIMIDLETTSKTVNSGIISLACLPFRLDNVPLIGKEPEHKMEYINLLGKTVLNGGVKDAIDTFQPIQIYVDLTTCFFAGMDMQGSQEWWLQQDPKVIYEVLNNSKLSIRDAIEKVYGYLADFAASYNVYVWSQGADFDFPKLEWCFEKLLEKESPYIYSNKRDARTFISESKVSFSELDFSGLPKHVALSDCYRQAIRVLAASEPQTNINSTREITADEIDSTDNTSGDASFSPGAVITGKLIADKVHNADNAKG